MRILANVPIRVGAIQYLETDSGAIEFHNNYRTYSIPVILGVSDHYLSDLIHIYMINKASAGSLDLMPTTKAFISWLTFISTHKINAFKSPKLHYQHPTYGYHAELRGRVANNQLSSSTASSYINVIRSFYEMLVDLKLVEPSQFFKYELSTAVKGRIIQSTDLRIRRRRVHGPSLNPLDTKTQMSFRKSISLRRPMYQLIYKLMLDSGLRISEACSLTAQIFTKLNPSPSNDTLIRGLTIGPTQGVNTKFGYSRELFITMTLYEEIISYTESDDYNVRLDKWHAINGHNHEYEPLFITNRGHQITPQSLYSDWQSLKLIINTSSNKTFTHHPHDLRATFATNYIGAAIKYFPEQIEEAISSTKEWMGHKSEQTTLKYVRFLNRRMIANQVAEVMDSLVCTTLGAMRDKIN